MENETTQSGHFIKDFLEKISEAKPYLDIVGVMIGTIDSAGIVRSINKKGCEMLGYAESDILGTHWIDRFVSDEHKERAREVLAHLNAGTITPFEYYENDIHDARGNIRNIAFHNGILRNTQGEIVGTIFAGEDITHHKKLEEKLVEQSNMLEAIGDNLPIGYSVNTISDGKAVFMNKRFEEIYGWPRDVIVDVDTFFDRVYPDPEFRKKIKEQVMMDIMSATPERMKWENLLITRQSGETAYITAQNIPLYEEDLMISTVWDVTRQVLTEKKLRSFEHLKQAVFDNLTDLVFVKDKEGKYVTANAAFLSFVHKTLDEIIGKKDAEIFPSEHADKYAIDDREIIETKTQKRIQETSTDANGHVVHFETIKTPFFDNNEFSGIIGVARIID